MIAVLLTLLVSPLLWVVSRLRRKTPIRRILVIQTAKIGDLICATHLFREIKRVYPAAHLAVLVHPTTREVIDTNRHVDEVLTVTGEEIRGISGKWRLARRIRSGRYDAIVCLNPNVPFAVTSLWALVPRRVSVMPDVRGVTYRMASMFFTDLREHDGKRLVVQTWLDMLGAIGVEGGSLDKEVYPVSGAESLVDALLSGALPPLMGIAVSSGNKLKELTSEAMSAIVRGLLESGEGTVLLIGGPMDRAKAAAILGSTEGGRRVIDVTAKLRLSELPALLRRLSVFVSVDTGIVYMADALSVPIVHMPGPINVLEQHPIGKSVRIVHGRVPCPPYAHVYRAPYECTREIRACIDSIDPDDVCMAARDLIEAADHGR